MSSSFNPYSEWMDIPLDEQPPNLYRLLGVEVFESDTKIIDDAAVRLSAELFQRAAASEHSSRLQALMKEIGSARRRLSNATRKARYDAELRVKLGRSLTSGPEDDEQPQERAVFEDIYHSNNDDGNDEQDLGASIELPARPAWLKNGESDGTLSDDDEGEAFAGSEPDEDFSEYEGESFEGESYEGESYEGESYEGESYESADAEFPDKAKADTATSESAPAGGRRHIVIAAAVVVIAAIGGGVVWSLNGGAGGDTGGGSNVADNTEGDPGSKDTDGSGAGGTLPGGDPSIDGAIDGVPGFGGQTRIAELLAVSAEEREQFDSDIQPLLSKYCERCHNADRAEGDVNLASATAFDRVKLSAGTWANARRLVDKAQMPPEGPRPTEAEQQTLMRWFDDMMSIDWTRNRYPGPRLAVRKTGRQYLASVRDLFGIPFDVRHLLPADPGGFGGADGASPLAQVSEDRRDGYRAVARAVADRVVSFDPETEQTWTVEEQVAANDFNGTKAHHIVVPMKDKRREWTIRLGVPFQVGVPAIHRVTLPRPGRYRIIVPLKSMDSIAGNVVELKTTGRLLAAWTVQAEAELAPHQVEVDLPGGELSFALALKHRPWWQWMYENDVLAAKEIENGNKDRKMQLIREGWEICSKNEFRMDAFVRLREDMLKGMKPLWISPEQRKAGKDYRHMEQMMLEVRGQPNRGRVGWESFRIEGPIVDLDDPIGDELKLTRLEIPANGDETKLEEFLRSLLQRAFQRRVDGDDVVRFVDMYRKSRRSASDDSPDAHGDALRHVLTAILISDDFLFAGAPQPESSGEKQADSEIAPADGMTIASRLAWFLWQSIPDERLFELARGGQLKNRETIASEVRRMCNDPRANAFYLRFMEEWLGYAELGKSFRPDVRKFPQATLALLASMKAEPALLLRELVQNDRSAALLLGSNTVFVDSELAAHYQLPEVKPGLVKLVKVKGEFRGGLTGMSVLLAAASPGNAPNPVRRGLLFRERVLGLRVSDPVEECRFSNADDAAVVRTEAKETGFDAGCARCHNRINPIGLALEQYDAIGALRYRYADDSEITIEATLDDGTVLKSVEDLKQWLSVTQREVFIRHLMRRLMEYALRRELQDYDEPALHEIYRAGLPEGFGLRRMIERICVSYPFRSVALEKKPEPVEEAEPEEPSTADDTPNASN